VQDDDAATESSGGASVTSFTSEVMGSLDTTVASDARNSRVVSKQGLAPQEVVAGRFVVERLMVWGGMGRIYPAVT